MAIPKTEVLITVAGAEHGRLVVEPGEYLIGRNPECAIKVEADLVSRLHAKLTLNFDNAFIEDLGSSNGTQVNGQPVAGNTRLWPNQKIQVGAATIELRRIKVESTPDMTVTPTGEVLRRVLPEEFLREKKYDIGDIVAKGGMGAILRAKEATTDRTVAMKVMLDTNDADALARFLNEARITAQLEHPNIVPVHELSLDENGQVFYTMKMVRGITLKKVLELVAEGVEATVRKYPLAALLTIFQKVCDALAFAHSKGVIHRDLKPENIMLADYGEVLVMDWGLAKRMRKAESGDRKEDASSREDEVHTIRQTLASADAAGAQLSALRSPLSGFTLAGTVMGTPTFMSPEQARGETDDLDPRSDIYALGAILFQALTLRLPVTGKDAWEIVAKVGRGEIEPLDCGSPLPLSVPQPAADAGHAQQAAPAPKRQRAAAVQRGRAKRAIPESLAAVVRKAMALDREARYRSVPELQHEIEAYQNGFATSAEKAGAWKQFTLLVKRNKAASIGVAMVAVLSVAFTMRVLHERNVAVGERNRAESERKTAAKERDRAEDALASLKKTSPTFAAQARGLVEQGNLEDALENIGFAVSLDTRNADYLLQQANLLQATQKLAEAAEGYRGVLALRADPAAKKNLDLCEKLLRDNAGSAELKRESLESLVSAMVGQGRAVEAGPLSRILGKDSNTAEAAIKARLKPLAPVPGFDAGSAVQRLPNGTFRLYLPYKPVAALPNLHGLPISEVEVGGTKISDLTPLKGLPIRYLGVWQTPISDLRPLVGMPLESLLADKTKISELTPLKGMPLTRLLISGNPGISDLSPLRGMALTGLGIQKSAVTDLRPLAGMPIEHLYVTATAVNDLSPLAGMPMTRLSASHTRIADLSPLRGMPLSILLLYNTPVRDLTPLAGMPIEELCITNTRVTDIGVVRTFPLKRLKVQCPVKDLSPLADCKALERLEIPKVTTDISFLRALPNLKRLTDEGNLSDSMDNTPAAEQFWQKYDAARLQKEWIEQQKEWFESERTRLEKELKQIGIIPTSIEPLPDGTIRVLIQDPKITKIPNFDWKGVSILGLSGTKVSDLTPLRGATVKKLLLGTTPVTSLEPLRGSPLVKIGLKDTKVTDISPLLDCPTLEEIVLPSGVTNMELLKKLPKLRYISYTAGPGPDFIPDQTAEQFWKEYDAQRAAPK